jgi:ABC-type transport system involved in multi-copper enzyme maturation permease subunit
MIGLASVPPWINENPDWLVAGAIVLLGLIVYGFNDLLRLSPMRIWAISGVCFAESIRKRVLWIIPLAILGVIIVAQLQHPVDEQDAIRESTKVCLFATGLVVSITAIILACTNLPKEIENRVIFTVVTKPTTRLEIVLGKIVGFARVSATILLLMGIFTMGYMEVRSTVLSAAIDQRLHDGDADPATTAMLTHYKEAGLLNARTYAQSNSMEIASREFQPGETVKWMFGGEGNFIVPFRLDPEQLAPANDSTQTPCSAGLAIVVQMGFESSKFGTQPTPAEQTDQQLPDTIAAPHPKGTSQETAPAVTRAAVNIQLLDENLNMVVDSRAMNNGQPLELTDSGGRTFLVAMLPQVDSLSLLKSKIVYVEVMGTSANVEYRVDREPVVIAVPLLNDKPGGPPVLDQRARVIRAMPDHDHGDQPTLPLLRTNVGLYGQQVRGGDGKIPVAEYQFRGVNPVPDSAGNVPFELRVGIERMGVGPERDAPTQVEATVVNRSGAAGSQQRYTTSVYPEINRTAFFTAPAAIVAGGDFDVLLRCKSNKQYIGLEKSSLNLVVSEHVFAFNLFKSLLVLWLMSILIVIISIFCSTFVSWPIAIVLTTLILLGHWGVTELGDSTAPGIGNLFATDMGLRDPSKMRVVSDSVEALTHMLNLLSKVLPDIAKFSALEDIERGVSLPLSRLTDSLGVIVIFGVPMIVLSYVFLRNKEVAP